MRLIAAGEVLEFWAAENNPKPTFTFYTARNDLQHFGKINSCHAEGVRHFIFDDRDRRSVVWQ